MSKTLSSIFSNSPASSYTILSKTKKGPPFLMSPSKDSPEMKTTNTKQNEKSEAKGSEAGEKSGPKTQWKSEAKSKEQGEKKEVTGSEVEKEDEGTGGTGGTGGDGKNEVRKEPTLELSSPLPVGSEESSDSQFESGSGEVLEEHVPKGLSWKYPSKGANKHQVMKGYHSYPFIPRLVGYVVNVHDPVNFDIDIWLTKDQRSRYVEVIKNTYTYYADSSQINGKSNIDFNRLQVKEATAYRCRLRGIGISNRDGVGNRKQTSYSAYKAIVKRINRQNGWVLVNISDVDMYQRLLVDIFDPVTGEDIKTVHLSKENAEVFYRYPDNHK